MRIISEASYAQYAVAIRSLDVVLPMASQSP